VRAWFIPSLARESFEARKKLIPLSALLLFPKVSEQNGEHASLQGNEKIAEWSRDVASEAVRMITEVSTHIRSKLYQPDIFLHHCSHGEEQGNEI
jgi:hypothetical protein